MAERAAGKLFEVLICLSARTLFSGSNPRNLKKPAKEDFFKLGYRSFDSKNLCILQVYFP